MLLKSRFVEMFGDPVLNPYKLKKDSFRHICEELFAGGDKPSDIVLTKDETHPYPVYANGYENLGFMGFSSQCRVNKPAITISARGTIGFSCIRQAGFTPIVRLLTLIPKTGIDLDYLKFAIDFYSFTSSGTSQKQLTVPDIAKYEVLVPDYSSQQCFATFVHQLDKLKVILNQIDEKIELLKKSRFVEMFGDINLPNTKWKMTPLGKNATLFNGRAYKQEELLDSGKYKLLRVGNFFSTKDWYYSDLELEADKYCDTGDLLFAWSASFGAKIWDQGKVIYHYHIWKVIPNENYNKEFLCFLLNEKTESLKKQTHGSTMMHLTKIGMEQTLFIVPPISLQNQFVDFIHQIDKLKFESYIKFIHY